MPSNQGIFTDVAFFNSSIPECVNISAGYDRQHSPKERLNITYLEKLVVALCKVDWASLPISRDTSDLGEPLAPWHGGGYNSEGYMVSAYGAEHARGNPTPKSKFSLDFEAMEAYAWVNPERIASYLTAMGITVNEVQSYWEEGDVPF